MNRAQLPLPFPHQPGYAAADFLAAPSNDAALTWLAQTEPWPDHRLALWGAPGCGKTHLLRLWAGRQGAILLRGPALRGLPDLPAAGGIALDEADAVPRPTDLLHLLNAAHEAALPVLLAAHAPPARWPVALPDLASRLRAITAVEILPPEDSLLRALLLRLLSDRQLAVTPGLQQWLLLRLPRSPAALREAVARLDQAALAAGGAVTRPIAAAVLAAMGEAGESDPVVAGEGSPEMTTSESDPGVAGEAGPATAGGNGSAMAGGNASVTAGQDGPARAAEESPSAGNPKGAGMLQGGEP